MPIWKSISNAFSNFWNKLGNENTNSTHTKSPEDDYNKRRQVLSPSDDDRQSNLWHSANKKQERIERAYDTWGYSRSVTSYREDNIHSQGSYVNASQSKPVSAYSSYVSGTRTSLGLSSHKESAQPGRSYTSPTPEISPRLAYSSNCGCTSHTPAVPSSRERAQIQSASVAAGVKVTPLTASCGPLEQKPRPVVASPRRENVEPPKVTAASAAQVKSPAVMLAKAGYPQPRSEKPSMVQFAAAQRVYTIGAQQPQLRRSLTTSERSRSLVSQDKAKPSPIQATRRSSASELVPEKNRIPKSQFQALNRHLNSYYAQNLGKCQEMEDEFFGGQESSYRNACLPYRPDQVNIWFREVVTRLPSTEPEGVPLRAYVDMINLVKTNDFRTMLTAVAKFRTILLEDGEELYFHATDAQSAKSILESGIDLTKTRSREDFSNGYGFYVTTEYTEAMKWASRKGGKCCHSTGAVIAFKVSRQLQKEQVHLFLEVNTAEGRRKWETTVSHFRNGEAIGALSVLLQNVKFIRGPVSKNAFLRPGETPVPYDFTQICLCDEEYATRYGSLRNICFVIFFKVD